MIGALIEGAEEFVRADYAVVPLHTPTDRGCTCSRGVACPSPGKHPRTRHGVHDASADLEQVRAWWRRWPFANVGVRVPEGCAVIDIDPRNGGEETFTSFVEAWGPVPTTMVTRTGGGGLHIWVRHPGPVVGTLGRGVDVKGPNGGLVVAPPSLHASGERYSWATSGDLGEASDDLAARLLRPGGVRRTRR